MQEARQIKKMDLRKVQQLQIKVLEEVDRICRKHNIKYYLIAGTLLGSALYKGFIPWDDDIDIGMLRQDYHKFLNCVSAELEKGYFVQNYHTDIDFRPALTRICIPGTRIIEPPTEHLRFNKAIYIDIFPLDNVPDDDKLMRKQIRVIKLLDRLILFKLDIVFDKGPFYIKLIVKKLLSWLLLPVPLKYLQELREKYMSKYSQDNTARVCNMVTYYLVIPREVLAEPVLVEFEGGRYYAPADWDAFLKICYGDYRTPPPDLRRKPKNDTYEW